MGTIMSPTATEDVRTSRYADCLHRWPANRKQTPNKCTEQKPGSTFLRCLKSLNKISFLLKLIASGRSREGRKTNKVNGIKQRLCKQKLQMLLLDRKCAVFLCKGGFTQAWQAANSTVLEQEKWADLGGKSSIHKQMTKCSKRTESDHRFWKHL